jgi:hypothetical protein
LDEHSLPSLQMGAQYLPSWKATQTLPAQQSVVSQRSLNALQLGPLPVVALAVVVGPDVAFVVAALLPEVSPLLPPPPPEPPLSFRSWRGERHPAARSKQQPMATVRIMGPPQ